MSNLFSSGGAGNVGFSGEVQQSLKFNDDESQYLSWTPAAAGNRKTWTWSGWVKRGNLGSYQRILQSTSTYSDSLLFNTDDTIIFWGSDASTWNLNTSAKFRDVSAWYHFVISVDTTQATSSDRIKIYVNGNLQSLSTASYPSQNLDCIINNTQAHYISGNSGSNQFLDGYLSDVYFIDGQALDPTSFGQFTNGYWEKIDYAGSYGTNGFHLTFADDVVSEGFNAVTYNGNGGTQSISGLGMEADLFWIKERSQANDHVLIDSVRGISQRLETNNTDAEVTMSPVNLITSIDADGFSLGSNGNANESGQTYVAWCWDAGTGSAASNTDGSITSTVKANPSYGFSVVSYAGSLSATGTATVGHGLSSAPEMIIFKGRDTASNWWTYHTSLTNQNYLLQLNTTAAEADKSGNGSMSAPTSTVFDTNYTGGINTSGDNHIAYCFHSVSGYSSFGSYEGDGTSDGSNAVTLGFKPAFVIIKNVDDVASWHMFDNTRDTVSPIGKYLTADTSDAESTLDLVEFTDTGFAPIFNGNAVNHTGETYIYMAFADTREAAFWKDVSGQGNHWTPNNLDYRDSLPDSPANNFATLNAVDKAGSGVLAEGNLKYDTSTSTYDPIRGTVSVSSGKWYWEIYCASQSGASANTFIAGIAKDTSNIFAASYFIGSDAGSYSMYFANGYKYNNGSGSAYGSSSTTGDIVSIALDLDAGTLTFYKNGVSQGVAYSGLSGTFAPAYSDVGTSGATSVVLNFGQDSTFAGARPAGGNQDDNGIGDFAYAPPSGFLSLCSANLPTSTIIDGSEHFNTVLYTGNGSTQSITGVGFQPDWTWIKMRSGADNNILQDAVRGVGKGLFSDLTNAENASMGGMTSFDSDGFTFDGSVTSLNGSGDSFVAWNWKAGGTAVSNTDGSITSQVSANVAAGFSIVSYTLPNASTPQTIGHGLGVAPDMVIAKYRSITGGWVVYHKDLGATQFIQLNSTGAAATASTIWDNTAPTSSVFSIGSNYVPNASSDTMIAYCFADVEGFSKAGSYTGNGSSDGPFVYTGFRPAWVMFKNTTASDDQWTVVDNKRDIDNPTTHSLFPSGSNSEDNSIGNGFINVDFVSNGFKIRQITHMINASSENYIYLAFAENPFKYANAR